MNELVRIIKDDVFTDSLVIAQGTGIGHRKIKEAIKRNKAEFEKLGKLSAPYQAESTGGRPEEYYKLNEPQATFLITLLKNTETVIAFKLELVKQFYQMRQLLQQKQSLHWQQTRLESKKNRKVETDEIKAFVQYATDQGSSHAIRYYTSFSKLADGAVGLPSSQRDVATTNQLNNLHLVENILSKTLVGCMEQKMYYKDIYKDCKARIEQFTEITYLVENKKPSIKQQLN